MPKITTPPINEGDVLDKDDLFQLKESMNDLAENIDGENIRQEGLDRRVFKNRSHARSQKGGEFNNVYVNERNLLPRSITWKRMRINDGLFNSADSLHPEMRINWDPETDSHCIIRASFLVDTRYTAKKPFNGNDAWEFGLMIKGPETTETGLFDSDGDPIPPEDGLTAFPEFAKTGFDFRSEYPNRVWPHQRMCLSFAFTRGARWGYYSWAESMDHKKHPEHSIDDSSTIAHHFQVLNSSKTAVLGPLYSPEALSHGKNQRSDFLEESRSDDAWDFSIHSDSMTWGFEEDQYPRGAWYQYAFSRQSNMNQSFTLLAHAGSSAENLNKGSFRWIKPGTARVGVYYRCKHSHAFPIDNPHIDHDVGVPNLENFRMSYQIIRR